MAEGRDPNSSSSLRKTDVNIGGRGSRRAIAFNKLLSQLIEEAGVEVGG